MNIKLTITALIYTFAKMVMRYDTIRRSIQIIIVDKLSLNLYNVKVNLH